MTTPHDLAQFGNLGVGYVGILAASALSGITSFQTYIHFRYGQRSGHGLRDILVGTVWFFDTLHVAFVAGALYYYLINKFGDINALEKLVWTWPLSIAISASEILLVHCLFAFRVWTLSEHNRPLLAAVLVFPAIAFGSEMYLVVHTILYPVTSSLTTGLRTFISLALASQTFADIFLTSTVFMHLHKMRATAGFKQTSSFIGKLQSYTVKTGLFPSMVSMSTLGCFIGIPDTFVFVALFFLLSKSYANCLLANLNIHRVIASDFLQSSDLKKDLNPTFVKIGDIVSASPPAPPPPTLTLSQNQNRNQNGEREGDKKGRGGGVLEGSGPVGRFCFRPKVNGASLARVFMPV